MEKSLKKRLKAFRALIIKDKRVIDRNNKLMCLLMSLSIVLACKAKDIYRKKVYGSTDAIR